MSKKINLIDNHSHGIDIIVDRDEGNPVRILTGNHSIEFWKKITKFSEQALKELKDRKKNKWYYGK
jgi:hypothetical protein